MKIIVCVKVVPDTASRLKVAEDGKQIATTDLTWIVSPYDEIAVEEGLKLREKHTGEVILLSVGPDRVVAGLRNGLAMGADRAHFMRGGCAATQQRLHHVGIAARHGIGRQFAAL